MVDKWGWRRTSTPFSRADRTTARGAAPNAVMSPCFPMSVLKRAWWMATNYLRVSLNLLIRYNHESRLTFVKAVQTFAWPAASNGVIGVVPIAVISPATVVTIFWKPDTTGANAVGSGIPPKPALSPLTTVLRALESFVTMLMLTTTCAEVMLPCLD